MIVGSRQMQTATLLSLLIGVACTDPNEPDRWRSQPSKLAPVPPQGGSLTRAAAQLVVDAASGIKRRGAQDDMLVTEARLPGYGGFYIDSTKEVVVIMKPGGGRIESIRGLVRQQYENHPNPKVREIMAAASQARLQPGDYSLSELIAIENRIPRAGVPIQGFRGLGTSIVQNRVVLGLSSVSDWGPALDALRSAGIPSAAIIPEVWDEIQPSTVYFYGSSPRPAGGGMHIAVPIPGDTLNYSGGSLGFAVWVL